MRTTTLLLLCILLAPFVHADERSTACDELTLSECLTTLKLRTTPLPPETMLLPYDFDSGIDMRAIKSKRWFKPVVFAYWIGSAIESYRDDDQFKLSDRVPRERTISAGFDVGHNGSRIVFDPRKALIIFPLGRHSSVNRLWAVHVTSHGGAVTFAFNLDRFRRRPF